MKRSLKKTAGFGGGYRSKNQSRVALLPHGQKNTFVEASFLAQPTAHRFGELSHSLHFCGANAFDRF